MRTLLLIAFTLLAAPSFAELQAYDLDKARSTVAFTFTMAGQDTKGQMPIQSADIGIDLANLSQSSATVVMNAARADAGVLFATEAMKSGNVLNTKTFPTIQFRTTGFTGTLNGGTVKGLLTIRDITRPVTMTAEIYRQKGSSAGDTSRLTVLMTGSVNRNDFGASGFPDIVAPTIKFEVLTRIDQSDT